MLRYSNVDQSGGMTDQQTDIAVPRAMPVAWLKKTNGLLKL